MSTSVPTLRSLRTDVVVIGAGQAGLAVAFLPQASSAPDAILLPRARRSVRTRGRVGVTAGSRFGCSRPPSGARFRAGCCRALRPSAIPVVMRPSISTRDDVIAYLAAYEERYDLPVERPVMVETVEAGENGRLAVQTNQVEISRPSGRERHRTWSEPFVPEIPGSLRL